MLRNKRIERVWKEQGVLPRPCLLHRLDKDTSGIVALARTELARRHLIRQFYDHTITKRYLAVIQKGAPAWAEPRNTLIVTRIEDGEEQPIYEFDASHAFFTTHHGEFVVHGPLGRDPDERRRCIVLAGGQEAATRVRVLATNGDFA